MARAGAVAVAPATTLTAPYVREPELLIVLFVPVALMTSPVTVAYSVVVRAPVPLRFSVLMAAAVFLSFVAVRAMVPEERSAVVISADVPESRVSFLEVLTVSCSAAKVPLPLTVTLSLKEAVTSLISPSVPMTTFLEENVSWILPVPLTTSLPF